MRVIESSICVHCDEKVYRGSDGRWYHMISMVTTCNCYATPLPVQEKLV